MTTGDEAKARELLANAKALLLDFDGPICSVFAGLPAPTVAEQLRVVLADGGHSDLPESVATTGDPFDVFRYAATLGDDEARYVEAAFTALEVEAITTAEPTPGAHDLIHAWHRSGRPLAIVSNNSLASVSSYLSLHRMTSLIRFVSARRTSNYASLKPSIFLLREAETRIGATLACSVFIGDSTSDARAALDAGVKIIGYANRPKKWATLSSVGADVIIDDLSTVIFF